jgi:hypothetical protein
MLGMDRHSHNADGVERCDERELIPIEYIPVTEIATLIAAPSVYSTSIGHSA